MQKLRQQGESGGGGVSFLSFVMSQLQSPYLASVCGLPLSVPSEQLIFLCDGSGISQMLGRRDPHSF